MAATEANAQPVQVEIVETKAELESTNAEPAPASTEETQSTTEPAPSTEPPADSKSKPASEKIWDSFLNKSGLGKVMGGKKKKEQHTDPEDTTGEEQDKTSNPNEQGDTAEPKDQAANQPAEATEAAPDGQTIEKAPENEEASQEQKAAGAKPKQGEKSSVRDLIRKPVAKIFSHKSTEKKDGADLKPTAPVRSRSLDRLQDADVSTVAADQTDEPQAADETGKPNTQTKHMKRWHSFKKLMGQKSHKKSTDDSKDAEGADGTSADGAGDTGTLDSTTKSEQTGQKRWKLKRSWTFQGMKRDPSVVGIHKPKDKDAADLQKEENAPEEEQGMEDVKVASDVETQEKTNAEGEEEKGATATAQHAKSADHHANEIWTSFKKRVIPKSKKTTDTGETEEEPAGDHEQTEEPQGVKDSGKTAKAKRTHFNRAVSLKNFILRKGKSTSVDMGESTAAQKEGDGTGESEAKDVDGLDDATGATDVPQTGSEEQTVAQSESNNEGQVAGEHKSSDGEEKSHTSTPSGQPSDKSQALDPAPEGGCQTELKANGENGCLDAKSEDTTAHNHEATTQNDVKDEENNQESIDSSGKTCPKDGKVLNQDGKCDTVNAVAQSGEFEAPIDSRGLQQNGNDKAESKVGLGTSVELETGGDGAPQCEGPLSGSATANADDQEEALKRMFYEVAASIVRTVVSSATEQLAKEMDLLDSSLRCFPPENNSIYTDSDVSYCHREVTLNQGYLY